MSQAARQTGDALPAGVYTFTGVYDPPRVDASDAAELRSLGIDYPQVRLETDPMKFMTER